MDIHASIIESAELLRPGKPAFNSRIDVLLGAAAWPSATKNKMIILIRAATQAAEGQRAEAAGTRKRVSKEALGMKLHYISFLLYSQYLCQFQLQTAPL